LAAGGSHANDRRRRCARIDFRVKISREPPRSNEEGRHAPEALPVGHVSERPRGTMCERIVVEAVRQGDPKRLMAIRDTIDGKPPQAITGEGGPFRAYRAPPSWPWHSLIPALSSRTPPITFSVVGLNEANPVSAPHREVYNSRKSLRNNYCRAEKPELSSVFHELTGYSEAGEW